MKVCKLLPFFAEGTDRARYLKAFDPEACNGYGWVEVTDNKAEAMRFETAADAMRLRLTVSKSRPRRPDGEPNRPLTAYHIEIFDEENESLL